MKNDIILATKNTKKHKETQKIQKKKKNMYLYRRGVLHTHFEK